MRNIKNINILITDITGEKILLNYDKYNTLYKNMK